MRLIAMEFAGFNAGVTDFGTLLQTTDQPKLVDLEYVLTVVAGQLVAPIVPNLFVSLIVVGHSDRQDRTDMNCDQRRVSEGEAARDRAVSAWDWIKDRVTAMAAESGVTAGTWWEDSPHVTWGLVFAAAGMLTFPNPASSVERTANRRVVVLASLFNPT